jgi:hypothetical protein
MPVSKVRYRRWHASQLVRRVGGIVLKGKARILEEKHHKSHKNGAGFEHETSCGEAGANCVSQRKSYVFPSGFSRGLSRTEYRSRKLYFLEFESYTSRSPVGDINCRVPTFPVGGCAVPTVIPRLLFAMETRPRSIAHFRVTLKMTLSVCCTNVCTICRLILRHCIDCPKNTLTKKWPHRS